MGNVGNTTGSMLYGFGAFLVIYLAGVLIYQVVLWIQKWKRKTENRKMANVIVVAVVIVLLGFALKGTLKHLKGESPCCGGGDTIIIEDKKLDGPVIGKKTVKISGMHCDHCVRAVTEAINKIDGVSAKVNLKKKEAVVSYEKVVEDAAIREAVEKAGYTVQSIQG